jgi:hypothetical protein
MVPIRWKKLPKYPLIPAALMGRLAVDRGASGFVCSIPASGGNGQTKAASGPALA